MYNGLLAVLYSFWCTIMENKLKSPSAAIRLVVVFLLPMAVFVGVALACKYLLTPYAEHQGLCTAISFAIAAAVTLAVLHIIRTVNRRRMKDK